MSETKTKNKIRPPSTTEHKNILDNFDWKFYCRHYPDLQKEGINTEKLAIKHYKDHGFAEKRIINESELKKRVKPSDYTRMNVNGNELIDDKLVLIEITDPDQIISFIDKGFPIFNYQEKIYYSDI